MYKVTIFILLNCIITIYNHPVLAQNTEAEMVKNIQMSAPGLKPVSVFVSETTIPVVVGVPVIMGAVSLINGDDELMKDAIYVGLASGINMGLTYGLKYSINRTRPYNEYPGFIVPDLYEDSPSFPSGHTSGAFATATALSLKYPKWYVVAPAFAWAGYVGYSRMHTGVHYPSDVAAGALLGAGSAWLTYRFNQWLWSKYDIDGIRLHKKR